MILATLIACRVARDLSPRATLDRQFDTYVKLVAALGERDPDSLDSYAGPPVWLEQARAEQRTLHWNPRSGVRARRGT